MCVHTDKLKMIEILKLYPKYKRNFMFFLAYHAPIDTYTQLSNDHLTLPESNVINVCVGKEWYRYPSSFFLPDKR